jgi:prepilin-type N-terminal cleavage/methylation domain-containing protein
MNIYFLSGFSLIEVLISLFLLSFILLGFNAMEVASLRAARAAYYFDAAANQMNNMVERLRALGLSTGLARQITIWNAQNKKTLPEGLGVVLGHYPFYTITIHWGKADFDCSQIHLGQAGCLQEIVTI